MMKGKFRKPFARYDREFPNDDRFLAMPERVRLPAYGLLLAMNGYCYGRAIANPPATGQLTTLEAEAIADKCGQKAAPLLSALQAARMIQLKGKAVILPRFFDWNPELKPEKQAERSEAARTAALARWGDADEDAEPHAEAHAPSHQNRNAESMPEVDKERDREALAISTVGGNTREHPQVVGYAKGWEELTARPLSPQDLEFIRRIPYEFSRVKPDDFLAQMRTSWAKHVAKGQPIQTVEYFKGWLRDQNSREADAVLARRNDTPPSSLSRISSTLEEVATAAMTKP